MAIEQPMTLGVVEDSDEDFAVFARVFKGWGPIHRWATGELALQALRNGDPDVATLGALVVDLRLPGMDGFEVIEAVRALPDGAHPLICVLSSSERPADMQRARAVGADGYLVKPNNVAGLRALPGELAQIAEAR